MRWLLVASALLVPVAAAGATFNIAIIGDPQNGTKCNEPPEAWQHVSQSVQWVADQGPGEFAYVMFLGDMINGRRWDPDCWCAAQPSVPDCTTLTNPYNETACGAGECGDANANACVGGYGYGDPGDGWLCEWSRARSLVDMVDAAGIPHAVIAGNHDDDGDIYGFETFNEYFGEGNLTTGVVEQGALTLDMHSGGVLPGVEMSTVFYNVFRAGGTNWLHVSMGYDYAGVDDIHPEAVKWVGQVIDNHAGMPTIVSSHRMVDVGEVWTDGIGIETYNNFATRGNVVMAIGGHIRDVFHYVTTVPSGRPLLAMATDWAFRLQTTPAPPDWQDHDVPNNGGGGIVGILSVDMVHGVVRFRNYSPEEDAVDERYDDSGDTEQATFWSEMIPFCGSGRFELSREACAGYREPSMAGGGSGGSGF